MMIDGSDVFTTCSHSTVPSAPHCQRARYQRAPHRRSTLWISVYRAQKGDAVDLSPYSRGFMDARTFLSFTPGTDTYARDRSTRLDRDEFRLGLPRGTTWAPTRNVHDTPDGGKRRERTATDDDNDNDITIACVLRWFRSYTEDQGTHTHVSAGPAGRRR